MKKICVILPCLLIALILLVSCGFEEDSQRVIANVYLPDVEAFNLAYYAEHSPTGETQDEILEKKVTNWVPTGTYYYEQGQQAKSFSATFEIASVDLSINTAYFSYIVKEPDGTELATDGIISAGCERSTEKGKRTIRIYLDNERCLEFTGTEGVESAIYRHNSTKYKLTSTAEASA